MRIDCSMSDVNSENVKIETSRVITEMMKLREKFPEEKSSFLRGAWTNFDIFRGDGGTQQFKMF